MTKAKENEGAAYLNGNTISGEGPTKTKALRFRLKRAVRSVNWEQNDRRRKEEEEKSKWKVKD